MEETKAVKVAAEEEWLKQSAALYFKVREERQHAARESSRVKKIKDKLKRQQNDHIIELE